MIEKLLKELSELEQVEAIALGGSRAGTAYDDNSDYDVYLYCTAPVSEEIRREILSGYCSVMEIGNHFWEYEDNCTLNHGVDIDILYRSLDDFVNDVASVVEGFHARNGYTTCMWHNLITCKIVYDRDGRLHAAKKRFDIPYPAKLKDNIIDRNMKLLCRSMPAYDHQIAKAVGRNDRVSINHRTAAFLESYFDVLFARNELTHPGEKRLMQLCRTQCTVLPDNFEDNLNCLFDDLFANPEKVSGDLSIIIEELKKVIK